MDSFILFWLILILLSILIASGLVYLVYWIPNRYGKRKLGVWLAIILVLIFLTPIFSFVFEDYLFFKSDVIKALKQHQVRLKDDFKLLSNENLGIGDYLSSV